MKQSILATTDTGYAVAPRVSITRLIDRDDRTDDEIRELKAHEMRVLTRRTIESYLLDDSILKALCEMFGQPALGSQLVDAKAAALQASVANGGPIDDFKRPAGDIYNAANRLFPSHKLGSDKRAFMKGICAPLVREQIPLYTELRRDVFGA